MARDTVRDPGKLRLLKERPRDDAAIEDMTAAAFGPDRVHKTVYRLREDVPARIGNRLQVGRFAARRGNRDVSRRIALGRVGQQSYDHLEQLGDAGAGLRGGEYDRDEVPLAQRALCDLANRALARTLRPGGDRREGLGAGLLQHHHRLVHPGVCRSVPLSQEDF